MKTTSTTPSSKPTVMRLLLEHSTLHAYCEQCPFETFVPCTENDPCIVYEKKEALKEQHKRQKPQCNGEIKFFAR
jgi:hypothetical protein